MKSLHIALTFAAALISISAGAQDAPKFKVVANRIEIQAGASNFKDWPSGGKTWHHGVGFIDPYGPAEYYCGQDFPEEKAHPLPAWAQAMTDGLLRPGDKPLLCVYRMKDGDLYVYDAVVGSLLTERIDGARNQMINIVVDGTGPYKGATGVWLGVTEGRGKPAKLGYSPGIPEALLKIMDGYIKIPNP